MPRETPQFGRFAGCGAHAGSQGGASSSARAGAAKKRQGGQTCHEGYALVKLTALGMASRWYGFLS
jgi:hypothetical protein